VILRTLLPLEFRRRRRARRAPEGPLRRLYQAPLPSSGSNWRDVDYVAVDLETTGRDAQSDEIVSAGWVELHGAVIQLGTARRRLVRPSRAMPERSAVIHAITDDEAAGGESLESVLAELLEALAGRVLVAHYTPTELGFLDAACRRCFGVGMLVPAVDTLQLARQCFVLRGREPARGELRLDALREHYGLPPHAIHDALGDALAAAELFLAQAEELAAGGSLHLGSVLAPV
jgi:DNA polymerase-3 subunit epsilon